MSDFNFLPPQQQLMGGMGTAWEPLGQETNLKPYRQDMSYDLYNKAGGSDPFSNTFTGFNVDRFRTSIMSDPRRMQQAEQLFTQINSMQFKGMSQFDPSQNGWNFGGMPQGSGVNSFAQLPSGGGMDVNNPANAAMQASASNAPSSSGIPPYLLPPNDPLRIAWESSGAGMFASQRDAAMQRTGGYSASSSSYNSGFDGTNNSFSNALPTSPIFSGSAPPISFGGQQLNLGEMQPEMQQQILAAMGSTPGDPFAATHQAAVGRAMGGGNGSVSEATDAISKLGKAIKDDLIPATQTYTEKVGSLVGIMRGDGSGGSFGGGSGFGGGGGGGVGTPGGGFDQWSDGQARPEVVNSGLAKMGIGNDFPNMNDGAYDGGGGGMGMRAPNFFRIRQGNAMFIQPMVRDMNQYMGQEAKQEQMLQSSGMISYADMMGGEYGTMQRSQASGQEFQLAMGKNVYNAYGGIANSVLGGDSARGIGGAISAIGEVSLGAGMVGGGIGSMFGPLGAAAGGLLAGGAAAIIGAGGYAASAGQDMYAIGSYQNSGDKTGDFQGAVGTTVQNLRYAAGTRSPQEQQRLQNATTYANDVNAFAAGDMSTQDLRAWSKANGFSGSDAVSQGVDTFFQNNASIGWDRKQQEPNLALDLMMNPNKLPGSNPQLLTLDPATNARNRANGAGLFNEQMSLGSSYAPFMQSFLPNAAGAMGVGAGDQAGMNGLMNMYTNRMYDVQQAGGNVSLYEQQLQSQISPIGKINQNRYQAGYGSVLGLDNYSALSKDPYIQADVEGIDAQRYGYQASDPGFAQNVSDPLLNRASYYSRSGKPQISGRIQNQLPQLNKMYDDASGYGEDISQSLRGYSEIDATNPQQGSVISKIASGDRLALSQNAAMLGDMRYQTMNLQTGMGVNYNDMSRDQYDILKKDQPDMFKLSYDQAKGGTKQWEQLIHDEGRGLDQFQYQQQTAQRNIGYQTDTGGATGVNAQGQANGGDGLAGLSQLFQSQGMTLQRGNGMGMWQVEDAQTQLSRTQQLNSVSQQGQSMALSNQQWNESFAMNQQQFNLSTNYQSQNMTIQRGQQVQQESWQSQDLSMSRNKMELNYGWQQEDFDRNIRFSRGRDRVDLERQQERAAITHSMDETQQGNSESRFKTETQWNKDEFDRKKQYFDQSKELTKEEMDMNKRHHDEQMALQQQAYNKQKEFMTQQWGLEDQRRLLDRQNEELQYKMSTDMAIEVKRVTDHTNLYKDALVASSTNTEEITAKLNLATTSMTLFTAAVQAFLGTMGGQSIFSTGSTAAATSPNNQAAGRFKRTK